MRKLLTASAAAFLASAAFPPFAAFRNGVSCGHAFIAVPPGLGACHIDLAMLLATWGIIAAATALLAIFITRKPATPFRLPRLPLPRLRLPRRPLSDEGKAAALVACVLGVVGVFVACVLVFV